MGHRGKNRFISLSEYIRVEFSTKRQGKNSVGTRHEPRSSLLLSTRSTISLVESWSLQTSRGERPQMSAILRSPVTVAKWEIEASSSLRYTMNIG